jgi:hypothetical protein
MEALYSQEDSCYLFLLEEAGRVGPIEKSKELTGNHTHYFLAGSIMLQ